MPKHGPNPRLIFLVLLYRGQLETTSNVFPSFGSRSLTARAARQTMTAGHPPRISTTNLVGGASAAPGHKPPQPAKVISPDPRTTLLHPHKPNIVICRAPRKQLRDRQPRRASGTDTPLSATASDAASGPSSCDLNPRSGGRGRPFSLFVHIRSRLPSFSRRPSAGARNEISILIYLLYCLTGLFFSEAGAADQSPQSHQPSHRR